MDFADRQWYHIYNRGNNREKIYFCRDHYLLFLHKVREYCLEHADIIAYCLMPNHFHLLVQTKSHLSEKPSTLNQKICTLLSSYTQAINKAENRTGSLFQPKTKAKLLSDSDYNYPLTCFHYIHQNPLKAGLVSELKDWPWSSYREYAGLGNGTLVSKPAAFEAFDISGAEDFTAQSNFAIDPERIKKLF